MKISVILLLIVCVGYIFLGNERVKFTLGSKNAIDYKNKRKDGILFLIVSCAILFFFAGARGDFSTDYKVYYYNFVNGKTRSLSEIFSMRDWGYALISKILYAITGNVPLCFLIIAGIMMTMYFLVIKKYSESYFLSLLLLIGVDNYIISFNLTRNILVVSIVFLALQFIWKRSLFKYILFILLASVIHRSALVMLPMYWILQLDFRKRKNFISACAVFVFMAICVFYTQKIALYIQSFIGINYLEYDDFGLDFGNIGSAVKSIVLFAFVIAYLKKINLDNPMERVLFNGCIINCFLQVLAAKVLMIQRVGYYFSGCYILLIPLIISRMKGKQKIVVTGCVVAFLFIYDIFFQNITEYYFFWDNQIFRY